MAKQTYLIPVEWAVFDRIEVEANSFEEAVAWTLENLDEIPLGTEPTYIDGSYKITGDDDVCAIGSEHAGKLVELLKEMGYGNAK
jgi:hypothetical protein